jgi:hypothetical protein
VQENAISSVGEMSKPVGMLNLLARLRRLKKSWWTGWDDEAFRESERDPLSHPALQRMTLEQLADLPFDRGSPPLGQGSMRHQDPCDNSP